MRQTICDRLISGYNSLYYSITEPVRLRIARLKYEKEFLCYKENPLVSIYIPTYNRADILMQRSIPTVLGQTYKNFELIIVGDHCTDKTEELVLKIGDSRIHFLNLSKRGYRYPPTAENHWLAGPVVAANKALQLISGEWIARLDDDDIWPIDHIETLLRFAQQGNYEFVSAQYVAERRNKRTIIDGVRARDSYYTRQSINLKDYGPKIGGTQTWLYRSYLRFFKYNINCWRKSWNRVNDIDFSLRIFKAGVRMGFLDKVMAYILPRPGEITIGFEAYKMTEQLKLNHFKFNLARTPHL